MSYNSEGVFQGHTPEDDEFENGITLGTRVGGTHESGRWSWVGVTIGKARTSDGELWWYVRWDDPGLDDEAMPTSLLKVLAREQD